MKRKLLLIALAIVITVSIVFGVIACGDDGDGELDDKIDGTYYLSIFNGADSDAYVYESEYIKLEEDGTCEYSCGWQGPDKQPVAPFVCSYTVTDETHGYSGKRIVFNVDEVDSINEYIDTYKNNLNRTFIWYYGTIKCIGDDSEINVEHDELYDTYQNNTYCKKGIKPVSYARGYYSVSDYSADVYLPPMIPALLVDGDVIKSGSKFTYSTMVLRPGGLGYYTIDINGTCRVLGGVIEFKDEDGDVFMYGKVKGRVLYTYSDNTDMSMKNWTGRYYRYNTATDVDISKPITINVVDSVALAELNSSNKQE